MEGCQLGKNFCGIKQNLVMDQNKGYLLMGQIRSKAAQIFPAKRLSLFLTHYQTRFKSADFFPAKRLNLFAIITEPLFKKN